VDVSDHALLFVVCLCYVFDSVSDVAVLCKVSISQSFEVKFHSALYHRGA